MEELFEICLDITSSLDRETIIRKYLLPKVFNGEILFSDIDCRLLESVINILEKGEVEIFYEDLKNILGDLTVEEILETYWKVGKCHNCEKVKTVTKCKNEHDEDCPNASFGTEDGCGNIFCDNCIHIYCRNDYPEYPECKAVRCPQCSEDF